MSRVKYPSLYQVNTRVWLTALSKPLGRAATLDDVPDAELDRLAERGFDWVWLLSAWQTGPKSREVSRSIPELRRGYEDVLPDLAEDDIAGSGFAVADYRVHRDLGGDAALAQLRVRMRRRGLRLMLDFVPNHTGLDHPWIEEHPEYYVAGTEQDLARTPHNYTWVERNGGDRLLAHGRDPYFPGWTDTLQLNYGNPATQGAMIGELARIAGQCDGVRCDMAMLVLPEVFERTWGIACEPFWPKATAKAREANPDFCFLAEVYWDLEWTLQQQGFDFTYDKRLYERLREGHARPVREHFFAGLDYQDKLARFLENHDEPRANAAFAPDVHRAAALVTYLSPGMRFFHQGQFEGRKKRIPPQLRRGPFEPIDEPVRAFYDRLLELLRRPLFREGRWQLLECAPEWPENWTWDSTIAFGWRADGGERAVVVVNYSQRQSQCRVRLPFDELCGAAWELYDIGPFSEARYELDGAELASQGLFVDLPPWGGHVLVFARRA